MKKLTKFFNLIKENKQTRILSIMTIAMLFMFTIGYSLSMFTGGSNKKVANIKINDLAFNITTNSGESNDRVLHLQAGKTELFKSTITNLNKMNTKYELIYKVCTDAKCTSYLDTLPSGVKVGLVTTTKSNVSGLLDANAFFEVDILTENNTSTDCYILLDLQAGYEWNDLALLNQFNDFSKYVSIIAYVDGVEVAEYPDSCNYTAKIIGYKNNKQITLEESGGTCTNNKWKIFYVGMPDKIQIKFKKKPTSSDYLASIDKESNGLEIDDTNDQNLRYVGATPKNYISFNNELWRIVGVFNVYNNDIKKTEKLIKIIRNDSLGNYSWDTSELGINHGCGVNEWSQADLMTELNTDYLDINKTSGTTAWYNGYNNAKNGSYDYSKNIKSGYIDKIANVRWNLGGSSSSSSISAKSFYSLERGTTHISNPSDGIKRTEYWDGKVGLMYPSDYGYASTDTTCRGALAFANCKNNNWLFNSSDQCVLSPQSSYAYRVFSVSSSGHVPDTDAYNALGVRPTLFLKSDVLITGGTGESSNPYQIALSDFDKDSWSTIAENVKNGNSSMYKVGDEKELNIGGTKYTVRVANNSTPSECKDANFSQTACGFVVEFVDIVESRAMNTHTNVGGWPATPIQAYANGDFFNKLPTDLQNVIIDTKVISGHGSTSGETNFTSTDKIYLLSAKEVWNGNSYDSAVNNTRQLDYYSANGVTTSNYTNAIKQNNGSNDVWWLRSACSSVSNSFLRVTSNGGWGSNESTYSYGFSPAFRIG